MPTQQKTISINRQRIVFAVTRQVSRHPTTSNESDASSSSSFIHNRSEQKSHQAADQRAEDHGQQQVATALFLASVRSAELPDADQTERACSHPHTSPSITLDHSVCCQHVRFGRFPSRWKRGRRVDLVDKSTNVSYRRCSFARRPRVRARAVP